MIPGIFAMPVWPLLCVLAFAATSASARDRVFDIIPPVGAAVETVDGYTVLRQSGTRFGAVLTFMPESDTTAWIPTAVLNTSGAPLKVGTHGVSARHGSTALKVWSTSGLVRLAKEGLISAPPGLAEDAPRGGSATEGPVGPSTPRTVGAPASSSGSTQGNASGGPPPMLSNKVKRQQDLIAEQVINFRDRLFRDEKIAPNEVGRGDVRIDLPPRGSAGQPAEFVLTLSFGGEQMDVLYREREAR